MTPRSLQSPRAPGQVGWTGMEALQDALKVPRAPWHSSDLSATLVSAALGSLGWHGRTAEHQRVCQPSILLLLAAQTSGFGHEMLL